jgi:hypothetical protein
MSNVEFDTDKDNNPRYAPRASSSVGTPLQYGQTQSIGSVGMARWLIRHGIISGDSGAKVILVGIVCLNFIAMGIILYFFVL